MDSLADTAATITLVHGGVGRAFDFTRTPLIVRGMTQGAVVSLRDVSPTESARWRRAPTWRTTMR